MQGSVQTLCFYLFKLNSVQLSSKKHSRSMTSESNFLIKCSIFGENTIVLLRVTLKGEL